MCFNYRLLNSRAAHLQWLLFSSLPCNKRDPVIKSYSAPPPPQFSIMAITPEEFFVEGLMEPSPSSPSIFLDLPPISDPNDRNKSQLLQDDLVLPYISRMLMEDDTILCQYSDHPALLQVQQPFAQILSSPSISTDDNNTANKGNVDQTKDLLQASSGDQSTLSLVSFNAEYAVESFLKGMEEANMFLPRDNSFMNSHQMDQILRKSSYHRHLEGDEEVGRTSKVMMVMEEPDEIGIHEMLDDMMLRGYETFIRDMDRLHITMNNEAEKKNRKGSSKVIARDAVDLQNLLIHCAQAVDANNHKIAGELLKQIKQHASATGDSAQRLAQCFSKGLESRLLGTGSQLCKSLMAEKPSAMEFLKAYNLYIAACSFNKVAHIFSTMNIMQIMVGKSRLHIVDYGDKNYGFQWAGLIRCLANRKGGPPEMRITAIASFHPMSCPIQWIEGQGRRLSKYASEFGMPFKFQAITIKWEEVSVENLNIDADEVLVVNDHLNFSNLMDESISFDDLSPRDVVLNNIRKMKPNIFIQSISNCSYGTSFLSRFREALFCYSAFFDMLDELVPRASEPRLMLEQGMLGHWALNAIACEGADLIERPEKYRQWQVRNGRAGLRQLPLKPDIVEVLKDVVKKHHHKDFLLCEDGQWLLQGWKGRVMFAHSTWVAEDASFD